MNEQEALARMVAPGQHRPGKWRGGILQIHVTRACNLACYSCTQGSQLGGKLEFMPPELFEQALLSLRGYWGVIGVFGGNPAMSPHFPAYCELLRKHVPFEQRGLWCNDLRTEENGRAARATFNPGVSNLNVHMDRGAWDRFKAWWPEAGPFGLDKDSRHSPCFVAMKDVGVPEDERWELISRCRINQEWSAACGLFRGELRGWFCEIAMSQSILHQHEPDYPDTGRPVDVLYDDGTKQWWQLPMHSFAAQVNKHCHDCSVPMQGHGQLAVGPESQEEQVSAAHAAIYKTKRRRPLQLVTQREQLGEPLPNMTRYLQNSGIP